jgi:hypothetical protein
MAVERLSTSDKRHLPADLKNGGEHVQIPRTLGTANRVELQDR